MSNHKGKQDYTKEDEAEIKRKLRYDADTGDFIWKEVVPIRAGDKAYNTKFAGKVAGKVVPNSDKYLAGYVSIHISSLMIKAHRLAWWFHYGEWPNGEINHINHIRGDNRISNLEIVDRGVQNKSASLRKDNTSGVCGVRLQGDGKWVAVINADKKRYTLGTFDNLFDAVCARRSAEIRFGFSPSHGKKHNQYVSVE